MLVMVMVMVMVMLMVGKEDNKGSRGERGLREGLYLLILPDQNMQNSFHHSLIMIHDEGYADNAELWTLSAAHIWGELIRVK